MIPAAKWTEELTSDPTAETSGQAANAASLEDGHFGSESNPAPGTTHVIIREDPHRVSGDQMALGLLAGAATGAALGSFMWMPCWF
ncbi:hypothetical protein Chor_010461 [Crotalus horridus]